ncbi:tyrosine-type recombinase/integrase [Caballeronia sp. M23-90]
MSNPISSKTARDRLAPRREPYFVRLRAGLFVGYRRNESGEGTWIARLRTLDGRQVYKSLGTFAEYDAATAACFAWVDALDKPVPVAEVKHTVSDACRAYVEYQRLHKSERASRDAAARFRQLVYGAAIGPVLLSALTIVHIHTWISDQLAGKEGEALRRGKDSANRQLATFKAALNFAYRTGMTNTDEAWRTVLPFRGVGRRREGYISATDRERLLSALAPDVRKLAIAALLTAARPGELSRVTAAHYDSTQGTLQLDGKTGHRTITLSSVARRFFDHLSKDKIGNAHLLTTRRGRPWIKETWIPEFTKGRNAAKLPATIVMYSLRHTAISDWISGGIDAFTVAKMAGTSTAIIDKHYGHLRADRTRDALDRISLLSAAA